MNPLESLFFSDFRYRWGAVMLVATLLLLVLFLPDQAHATTAGGTGLPWESPIQRIVESFLGPVATGMCLIGFVVGVSGFLYGGEINGLVRSMVVLVLAGSVLMAARPFINSLFGVGALIG
jgi:type IV secretory pathway VirB2 component (pilin)